MFCVGAVCTVHRQHYAPWVVRGSNGKGVQITDVNTLLDGFHKPHRAHMVCGVICSGNLSSVQQQQDTVMLLIALCGWSSNTNLSI